ncbi:ParB/RepB/Spo0J family partition protein [Streptomyces sp. TRM76323]|uniref:ParB/RepB/Spo0J family partition protein n=1 Tax=Streptomyces tamarix TaxID=3078565 RepID=A0ABU3QI17_9ACTN|nr:ParB/RepB/Spo0J family partition protein [Streptomyces tamarix]MDT9682168.1 ParB/RepB/Spo0J family partition protein [Streptomyces tamarix]
MSSADVDDIRPLSPTLSAAARSDIPVDTLLPADSPRTKGLDQEYVDSLVALDGELPPIVVHHPTGRVVDGMHRLAAARARGDRTISAYLLDVPERSLFAVAVSLNISHGKPLTHSDRLAAAARILRENPALSDRYVASVTALSPRTVSRVRRSTAEVPHLNTRIGLDGKRRPADVAGVASGRQRAGQLMLERPGASLREIARAAGISLGTAHDVKKRLLLGRNPVPEGRAGQPEPRVPAPRRPRHETTSLRDSGELLERLRKDPALRLSQSGRFLLRCFAVHDVDASVWARLATTIPPHCAEGVSKLARECADMWLRFADRVDREAGAARAGQRSHTSA